MISSSDSSFFIPHSSFSSLHTHTVFCDGKDDVETMCRIAFDKGLAAIGFSAHAPLEKAGLETFWNMKNERMGDYINEVNAARRRWEGKLAVYLGLELDYIKGLRSAWDSDIRECNFDYIIGSVHFVVPPEGAPNGAPFTIDGSAAELEKGIAEGFAGDGAAMMQAYWDAMAEMIALGGIDIVGHLDLVKKNHAARPWLAMDRIDGIARAIAAAGLVVEVNTGIINRGYLSEPCPSPAILRLLRQHNVPVTITADAHRAEHLDGNYPIACQTLLDAGYTSHVTFAGRKNNKPTWYEQKLFPF
ncbi:MAG: histidinol-phosphatase [Treponema sp.]|nr:histidinol-phosphatase [Treponema sp.]